MHAGVLGNVSRKNIARFTTSRDQMVYYLGTDHYFFVGGGWKILKKIVCKDKKVQINCLHT